MIRIRNLETAMYVLGASLPHKGVHLDGPVMRLYTSARASAQGINGQYIADERLLEMQNSVFYAEKH